MFSPGHAGANAYARVGVETGVMGASPHRLIVMLYQGARQAIAQARMHLQQGQRRRGARRGDQQGDPDYRKRAAGSRSTSKRAVRSQSG